MKVHIMWSCICLALVLAFTVVPDLELQSTKHRNWLLEKEVDELTSHLQMCRASSRIFEKMAEENAQSASESDALLFNCLQDSGE